MKKYPKKEQLNNIQCKNCENLAIIQGIPFCRIIAPRIDTESSDCEDFKEIIKIKGKQISIFDLTSK